MNKRAKILLQTTIPYTEDDWHIGRFSLLTEHLRSLGYDVTARNREPNGNGIDPLLSKFNESDFDQIWLFGLETEGGLTPEECEAITKFRQRGGGILATRDHFDMGCSMCTIGGVGQAHYFHSKHQDPDQTRRCRDDNVTLSIDWPNYHSGANGDFQQIYPTDHPLLRRADGTLIEFFPSHPHEGAVGAPEGANAKVVATSKSLTTGRPFNLVVAFDNEIDKHGNDLGRAIAESSFHHMVDYNWNPELGCPTFVEEAPGEGYKREPEKLSDIKQYLANAAAWLSGS